jgi:hypothetical protein
MSTAPLRPSWELKLAAVAGLLQEVPNRGEIQPNETKDAKESKWICDM